MGNTLLLDTNVLVRFLTNDDPHKAHRCEKLFRQATKGDVTFRLSDVCLAELVWTLESYYQLERKDIADKITAVLNTDGFEVDNETLWLDAMRRYAESKVDLIDAFHAAMAAQANLPVCSFDRDFDQFHDVQRVEP